MFFSREQNKKNVATAPIPPLTYTRARAHHFNGPSKSSSFCSCLFYHIDDNWQPESHYALPDTACPSEL